MYRKTRAEARRCQDASPPPGRLSGPRSKAPEKTLAVQSELDLLKTALELERQTSGFYRQLVDTLPTGDRELFARFLEIEQGHLTIVQAEIDNLNGMGTWFDIMEFDLEAG